jgi:hypothetical protein
MMETNCNSDASLTRDAVLLCSPPGTTRTSSMKLTSLVTPPIKSLLPILCYLFKVNNTLH